MPTFSPPDFSQPAFANFPDARFAPAPADGVLPDGFFSTTNLPTFVRVNGRWIAPQEPRMDAGLVLDRDGAIWVREGRRIKKGDMVAVGEKEDGSDGIFVQTHMGAHADASDAFAFMSSEVSREKPIDYAHMARVLVDEKERGAFHQRIRRAAQELFVHAEQVLLPQVRGEPGAAGLPDSVIAGVDRSGAAPQVEIMMYDPASSVIVFLRDRGAGLRKVLHRIAERHLAFQQVGRAGGPVARSRLPARVRTCASPQRRGSCHG